MSVRFVHSERGFTLVEIIVAMALFSMMLSIIVVGLIAIMHMHQQGVASRNTQQNLRYGMEEMVRDGRSARSVKVTPSPLGSNFVRMCYYGTTNPIQYYVANNGGVNRLYMYVLPPTDTTCNTDPVPVAGNNNPRALSSDDVKIIKFMAVPGDIDGTDYRSVDIDMTIGTGGVVADSCPTQDQFCVVSNISSSVTMRGR